MSEREDQEVDLVGNNLDSCTPIPPPIEAAPRFSDVLRAGLITGITASLACWLLYGIASLFRTTFDVTVADGRAMHIGWFMVLLLPLLSALAFALLATALRRRRGCRALTAGLGYLLGALSIAAVLLLPEASVATRVWLVLFHLVTIALIVPQIARVVGDSDPRVLAGHRRSGLDSSAS